MLQKYYQTEKDLEQEKEANSKLNSELTIAQKTLKELSIRSFEGSMLFEVSSSFKKDSDPDERRP